MKSGLPGALYLAAVSNTDTDGEVGSPLNCLLAGCASSLSVPPALHFYIFRHGPKLSTDNSVGNVLPLNSGGIAASNPLPIV